MKQFELRQSLLAHKLGGIGHIPFERDEYYKGVVKVLGRDILCKSDVYDALGYHILPTVEKMHRSRATHRIFVGGNRGGKSEGGAWEILPYLFLNTKGWVVSANYDMADVIRQKIEAILIERAGCKKRPRPDSLKEFEFAYVIREHEFTMWTGAKLRLRSAENPDSMHAVALDYIVNDEAALIPYTLYDTRFVPRLIDSGGWILNLGTFEFLQGEWFEEYYEIGQTPNDWDIESWRHPTEDNYHIFHAHGGESTKDLQEIYRVNAYKIEEMNPELEWPLRAGDQAYIFNIDLVWLEKEKARIEPETYQARYEAVSAPNKYLVFPKWKITEHVDAERAKFDSSLPVYLVVDPGGTYAVGAIQLKRFDDILSTNVISKGYHICLIDSLYFQTTVTTTEVFNACSKREWWPNVHRKVDHWDSFQGVIDVIAKEQQRAWRNEARSDGMRLILRGKKVEINDGIKTFQHYLDTKTFWSHPRNKFLSVEMKRFHWKPASLARLDTEDPRKAMRPISAWCHLIKPIWYFMVQKFGYYGRSESSAVVRKERFTRLRETRHSRVQI